MARIGVLVVDDSVVIRRLVSAILGEDPELEVVGTAANGRIALDKLTQMRPDIVTLDVEMPTMDGLATLRAIRRSHPTLPVIMFSTMTERGASATLDALAAGASDYVTKPANLGSVNASIESIRTQLVPKIKALVAGRPSAVSGAAAVPRRVELARYRPSRIDLVAIGSSTGGPDALTKLLGVLPATLPVPVLVVQHMPPLFTRLFADRLDRSTPLRVREAVDGEALTSGTVLIAPGGRHLTVRRDGATVRIVTTEDPPENYCRPSVDVLFRSVARVFGAASLACVLTGMGKDGRRGSEQVWSAGGRVIAQDAESSVVWGMPGAVAQAGFATDVLPLGQIAGVIVAATGAGRKAGEPGVSTPHIVWRSGSMAAGGAR